MTCDIYLSLADLTEQGAYFIPNIINVKLIEFRNITFEIFKVCAHTDILLCG